MLLLIKDQFVRVGKNIEVADVKPLMVISLIIHHTKN